MNAAESIPAFRDGLLKDTFEWCRTRSPYYRERFARVDTFRGLQDLSRLPVLFRKDVVEHHQALRCDASLPMAVQHTTGTTGTFLQLYRSAAEQSFMWEFFSAQLEAAPEAGLRPLYVNLINPYHGNPISVPSRAYVLSVGIFDRAQATQARGVIEREYDLPGVEPRVSTICGTERMVMALTAYLLEDGFDLAHSSIRTVVLFGGHVPASRKRLLAGLWRAQIKDQYSLTEMFGGARECGIGGPWIFDPQVIPEVVHPRTLEPVTEGVGVLLLTGLYPFVQQMPLVRYFTGDLVEIVAGPQVDGGLQVHYVGRLPRSILDTTGDTVEPLLLSGALYEELLDIPDVAIAPRFLDLPQGPGMELTGDLHYAVDHIPALGPRPEEIVIRLGLRYAPWMYPKRIDEVIQQLVKQLFRRHPALGTRVTSGALALRVLPLPARDVAPYDSK